MLIYQKLVVADLDLASFKAQVDKLDIDKLKNVLAALSMLNNVVDNDVAKKNV